LLAGFFSILQTLSFGFDFLIILFGPIALGIFILISMILIYPVDFYSFLPPLYVVSCKNISTEEKPNTWQPQIGKNTPFFPWIFNIMYLVFWFFVALVFCIPPLTQLLSLGMILMILLSGVITAHGEKILSENKSEPYGFFEFFKDTLKFKSWFFMAILTVGVIQGVPLFFDSITSTIVVFVLVLLIILELMGWEYNPLPIYAKNIPDYLSPETKYEQPVDKKGCKDISIFYEAIPSDPNKKGIIDRWVDWFIDKGIFIWSLTPYGRAATVAGTLASKSIANAQGIASKAQGIASKAQGIASKAQGIASNAQGITQGIANTQSQVQGFGQSIANIQAQAQSLGQPLVTGQPLPLVTTPVPVTAQIPITTQVPVTTQIPVTTQVPVKTNVPLVTTQSPTFSFGKAPTGKSISFGKKKGGGSGETDYSKIAQTLKKILRD
jgi:hypothetical protein